MAQNSNTAVRSTLLNTMLDASPGDRSMLDAVVQNPTQDMQLVTNAGTTNFRLWSQMVELGWMVQEPDRVLPKAPSMVLKTFSLTDTGRAALPELLADFKRHQSEHSTKMTATSRRTGSRYRYVDVSDAGRDRHEELPPRIPSSRSRKHRQTGET